MSQTSETGKTPRYSKNLIGLRRARPSEKASQTSCGVVSSECETNVDEATTPATVSEATMPTFEGTNGSYGDTMSASEPTMAFEIPNFETEHLFAQDDRWIKLNKDLDLMETEAQRFVQLIDERLKGYTSDEPPVRPRPGRSGSSMAKRLSQHFPGGILTKSGPRSDASSSSRTPTFASQFSPQPRLSFSRFSKSDFAMKSLKSSKSSKSIGSTISPKPFDEESLSPKSSPRPAKEQEDFSKSPQSVACQTPKSSPRSSPITGHRAYAKPSPNSPVSPVTPISRKLSGAVVVGGSDTESSTDDVFNDAFMSEEKVDLGGGLHMQWKEVMEIAQSRINPMSDDLQGVKKPGKLGDSSKQMQIHKNSDSSKSTDNSTVLDDESHDSAVRLAKAQRELLETEKQILEWDEKELLEQMRDSGNITEIDSKMETLKVRRQSINNDEKALENV